MIFDMRLFPVIFFMFMVCAGHTAAQDITYYKDIAPLIEAKCAVCHKPGDSGPFSLLTYEDVAKRASFIKEVTQSGYMPPWKADKHYVSFANERSLTDKEIETIAKWVDNKMPKGKENTAVAAKINLAPSTRYNRKPDLILQTADSFHVAGDIQERI